MYYFTFLFILIFNIVRFLFSLKLIIFNACFSDSRIRHGCRPAARLLLLLPALALAAGLSARSLVKADVQLANNAVLAMYQDEDANMWIGTYDGLHLYNGKNTFVFRMELDNEFSLCSNIVLEIAPAEKGYLWVATSLGDQ